MEAVFLKLVNMSLSASWLVLAVIAARLVLKKAPKAVRCVLWGLVALRLLCPFSIESPLSLIPETKSVEITEQKTAAYEPGEVIAFSSTPTNPISQDQTAQGEAHVVIAVGSSEATPTDEGPGWQTILSRIWIAGMVVMLAYALWSYQRVHKKASASIDIGNGVRICDYIDSPFILGIVRPQIYLPSALLPDSAAYVLAHERAHLKRRDHWWKPLGFVLLSIYWFNPLLWVAYVLLCRDIELACDERVVKEMGSLDKKAYSEALLSCSVPRRMIAACPLAFGEVGVKERVKAVLNYKKPAFWLVVIAAAVCLVIAVCFLTDPLSATLADLGEIREEEIVCINVRSQSGELHLEGDQLPRILEILKSTEYHSDPISDERREATSDEYGWRYPAIEVNYAESQYTLYFTYDCSEVWASDGVKPTNPHSVVNPEALCQFLSDYAEPVGTHTAAGEPFAAADEPWQWMQNISTDVVKNVRLFYDQTGSDSKSSGLSSAYFTELLELLHSIPEDAIQEGQTNTLSYDSIRYGTASDDPQATLVILDAANDLSIVLRIRGEAVQLMLLTSDVLSDSLFQENAISWKLESKELLAWFRKLAEDPPVLSVTAGSRFSLERIPVSVSCGSVSLSTLRYTDWDYEVVEYTEGAESFGIRCRPKAVDDGWIYLSFWPDGYDPVEEGRYYQSRGSEFSAVCSWPAEAYTSSGLNSQDFIYSYDKVEYPIGDYALINDGADSWFQEYRELITYARVFTTFRYGSTYDSQDAVKMYGDVVVDFTAACTTNTDGTICWNYILSYFDWEEIAAELKTTELVLLDPQEQDDLLFVGCQYGSKCAFVVFQQDENGFYALRELLYGSRVQERREDSITTVFGATYETGDQTLYLCLVDNETATSIHFYGEIFDYILLDPKPSLLVLDITGIDVIGSLSYQLDYDEPLFLSHRISGSGIQFGAKEDAADSQWQIAYITGAFGAFYDGTDFPGVFFPTQEEILQVRDILLSIPSEDITPGFEEKELYSNLTIACSDGILGNGGGRSYIDLTYENGSVTMHLYRIDESKDTPQEEFTAMVQNDALNAFMEGLCDSGRTESEVTHNTDGYTLTERYVEYRWDFASIRLREQTGWVYEIVEYTDDETPFGIRCRPEWAEEGWLFFAYCPGGFDPEDGGCYLETNEPSGDVELGWIRSYPEDPQYDIHSRSYPSDWTYTHYQGTPGDYVVFNEGAKSWLGKESGRWPIRYLFWYPLLGEENLNQAEVIQIVRDLYDADTRSALRTGDIDATASNLTLTFDFHTGVWTVLVPVKDSENRYIQLQLDQAGSLLSMELVLR